MKGQSSLFSAATLPQSMNRRSHMKRPKMPKAKLPQQVKTGRMKALHTPGQAAVTSRAKRGKAPSDMALLKKINV